MYKYALSYGVIYYEFSCMRKCKQYELKSLLPWQHTGFQASPILKAFLATFSVPFSHFQMVPCMYDPAGI